MLLLPHAGRCGAARTRRVIDQSVSHWRRKISKKLPNIVDFNPVTRDVANVANVAIVAIFAEIQRACVAGAAGPRCRVADRPDKLLVDFIGKIMRRGTHREISTKRTRSSLRQLLV